MQSGMRIPTAAATCPCRTCVSDGALEMIVADEGSGVETPEVEQGMAASMDGGMGMSIIRTIVDELDVQPGADGRGTVVRMRKRLAPVGLRGAYREPSSSASAAPRVAAIGRTRSSAVISKMRRADAGREDDSNLCSVLRELPRRANEESQNRRIHERDASEVRDDELLASHLGERRLEVGSGEGIQLAGGDDDPRVAFLFERDAMHAGR